MWRSRHGVGHRFCWWEWLVAELLAFTSWDDCKIQFQPGITNLIVQHLAGTQIVASSAQFTGGKVKVKSLSRVWLFATPGFSVHGIFQARVLEWVAISFSRRSSRPRDWTWVSRIASHQVSFQHDFGMVQFSSRPVCSASQQFNEQQFYQCPFKICLTQTQQDGCF